mmetsp:Transcript_28863/g.69557  ORF Transcript_28863/g.69557 Transcript_28863/m.69557 type:complete len:524 (+) Transcript_28863:103-1674(+)
MIMAPFIKSNRRHRRWQSSPQLMLMLGIIVAAIVLYFNIGNDTSRILDNHLKNLHHLHLPPQLSQRVIIKRDDDWDPSSSEMDQLKHISFPHGKFFFGLDSHEMNIPESDVSDPSTSWTSLQRELLDDDSDEIKLEEEKSRCASYDFGFPNSTTTPRRRRLFYGAMISDDSTEVIRATSMEQYNIFHTVSLIESNITHNLTPKKWRFFGSESASKKLSWLYQTFGPKTKVSLDYYVTSLEKDHYDAMLVEGMQREGHSYRWKFNGMRPDDIVIVGDLDETYSRDFLRALQICDVPQFRPGQDCKSPKLLGSTLVFESSPKCVWKGRRWYHPDVILGECVDQIGDTKVHPPTKHRVWGSHGERVDGYGHAGNYSQYEADILGPLNLTGKYPLWFPSEIRVESGGVMVSRKDKWNSPTGYHFHNFFESAEEVRFKYLTYGHPTKGALEKPLRDLNGDLLLAVTCAEGNRTENQERSFDSTPGNAKPIYYLNEEARHARHSLWQDIVKQDKAKNSKYAKQDKAKNG